jgi:hypothetical protein
VIFCLIRALARLTSGSPSFGVIATVARSLEICLAPAFRFLVGNAPDGHHPAVRSAASLAAALPSLPRSECVTRQSRHAGAPAAQSTLILIELRCIKFRLLVNTKITQSLRPAIRHWQLVSYCILVQQLSSSAVTREVRRTF